MRNHWDEKGNCNESELISSIIMTIFLIPKAIIRRRRSNPPLYLDDKSKEENGSCTTKKPICACDTGIYELQLIQLLPKFIVST